MRTSPPRDPDLEVMLAFVPPGAGGRRSMPESGYRADLDLGHGGELNGAHVEFATAEHAPPGAPVQASVWLLAPALNAGRLANGATFAVHEGARVVASGRILRVVNPALLRGA